MLYGYFYPQYEVYCIIMVVQYDPMAENQFILSWILQLTAFGVIAQRPFKKSKTKPV